MDSKIISGAKRGAFLDVNNNLGQANLVKVDAENNLLAIKGAIPGPKGGIVVIRDSVKKA